MKTSQIIAAKIGAAIIFLLLFQSIIAQSTWKHINKNQNSGDFSVLVYLGCTEDLSGNTYCIGINVNEEFEDDLLFNPFVAALDKNGKVLFERGELKTEYGLVHIAQIPNTETFYTLSFSILSRTWRTTIWDYELNIISETIVETDAQADIVDYVFIHSKLKNGNLLFVTNGEEGSEDYALFTEVDPNGKVVMTKVTYLDFCATVVEKPNSPGYYCIGDHAIELDSSFEVVQELGFVDVPGETQYGTTSMSYNSKILVNYISIDDLPELSLFDKDMNVLKTTTNDLTTNVSGFIFNSMVISEDKKIYTAHIAYLDDQFEGKSSIVLTKYDEDLNQIWETMIEDSTMSLDGSQISLSQDGGIIITGFGGTPEFDFGEEFTNAFVIKLDGNGMLSNTNELKSSLIATNVYPNPSSGALNILLQNINQDAVLNLIDATGKIVIQKVINGKDLNKFDLSSLQNGIYHYQILSNNKNIASGKWVKMQ